MAQYQFDATQHNAAQSFDALPKGWYKAFITESKARTTASGGQALDFVAEIFEPAFAKGRKVFLGYNVVNANEEAVRIGFEQLAALSIACGHPKWNATEELHNKPFHIKLKIEKAQEGTDYEDRNQPNGYDPITVHRALAVQPGAAGAPVNTAFPGAAAPQAPAAAPFVPPTPPVQTPAPVQQPAAVQTPVQPPVQQPLVPQPVQQPTAQPQFVQQAPAQPWDQPAVQQPVQQPVKSPEQIAWEQQQAAAAAEAQQPAVQQPQPVQQPVQQPAAPAVDPTAQPWANQVATPAPQQAAAQQAAPAVSEPPHPAQAQVPPWQQQPQ